MEHQSLELFSDLSVHFIALSAGFTVAAAVRLRRCSLRAAAKVPHTIKARGQPDAPATTPLVAATPRPPEAALREGHGLEVIRAAMDIGSGQHKLCIATVDPTTNSILRILHKEQRQVLLNHALVQAGTGLLNDEVLGDSFDALAAFKRRGLELGATQFAGVATAVFRRASNGEAYLQRVNAELGLGLRVVSQRVEGELGFLAATSCRSRTRRDLPVEESPTPQRRAAASGTAGAASGTAGGCGEGLKRIASWASPLSDGGPEAEAGLKPSGVALKRVPSWASPLNEGIVAWDSGGGSFQVSALVDGELCVWEGPVGDSNVTAMLLEVQGRAFSGAAHGKRSSPNPVALADATKLVDALDALLPPAPDWLQELCSLSSTRVVGFGEVTSLCALCSEINGNVTEMSEGDPP